MRIAIFCESPAERISRDVFAHANACTRLSPALGLSTARPRFGLVQGAAAIFRRAATNLAPVASVPQVDAPMASGTVRTCRLDDETVDGNMIGTGVVGSWPDQIVRHIIVYLCHRRMPTGRPPCATFTPWSASAISRQSLDFYCNKLGLTEIRRIDNEQGRFTLVFLAAPDDEAAPGAKRPRCWS